VLTMFLAFGVTFEIPIVGRAAGALRPGEVEQLVEWRSYVILGNAVVAQ